VSGTYQNAQLANGNWAAFSLAIPFRLKKSFFSSRITSSLDADLNLLSLFKLNGGNKTANAQDITFASSPLRFKLQWSPFRRWLVYGGASWSLIEEAGINFNTGYFGGIGIRF
jgi:hypothetical protein